MQSRSHGNAKYMQNAVTGNAEAGSCRMQSRGCKIHAAAECIHGMQNACRMQSLQCRGWQNAMAEMDFLHLKSIHTWF